MLAFTITTTLALPLTEDNEIAEAILKIRSFDSGANKVVRVVGEFNPVNDINVLTLLTSLKNSGYLIIAETDGGLFHQWFTFPINVNNKITGTVDWLIVSLHAGEIWPGFQVNELRYVLDDYDNDEPILPERIEGVMLFLSTFNIPLTDVEFTKTLDWIKRTKHKWQLWLSSNEIFSTSVL